MLLRNHSAHMNPSEFFFFGKSKTDMTHFAIQEEKIVRKIVGCVFQS